MPATSRTDADHVFPVGRVGAGVGGVGGIGGLIVLLVILFAGGGGNLGDALENLQAEAPAGSSARVPGAPDPDKDLVDFLRAVDVDLQDFWKATFSTAGQEYQEATLVLFTQAVQTGCGIGSAQTGPFYCPVDQRAYIDLSFYRRVLAQDFGAPGDFARAYVLAHEYGHHVQTLLGIDDEVRSKVDEDPGRRNDLSIRQELQADCFAGVWGHSVYRRNLLEEGDLEKALTAAAAIGDDRIQQTTQGRVTPENWTHGSSEQRVRWFRAGFDSGDPTACDTFTDT